jgi:hypothetical protein
MSHEPVWIGGCQVWLIGRMARDRSVTIWPIVVVWSALDDRRCRRRPAGSGLSSQVGVVDGVRVAGAGLDAEAEQVGEAAGVAAGGVGFVEDAVFTDGAGVEAGAEGKARLSIP